MMVNIKVKVMKAPEDKLYINLFKGVYNVCSYPVGNAHEYIRTDAFIEKATEYLSYHLDTSKIDVNYKFEFIEEFRKHLKGE